MGNNWMRKRRRRGLFCNEFFWIQLKSEVATLKGSDWIEICTVFVSSLFLPSPVLVHRFWKVWDDTVWSTVLFKYQSDHKHWDYPEYALSQSVRTLPMRISNLHEICIEYGQYPQLLYDHHFIHQRLRNPKLICLAYLPFERSLVLP